MSIDQSLSKDAATVSEILATLQEKDKDETICRYPTCHNLRQITTGTGRPSAYCQNPEHTAVSNHRARQQLRAIMANATTEMTSKQEHIASTGIVQSESLRQSVMHGMLQLQSNLERYVVQLKEIADPDVSAAQIQATLDRAEARIAEAQQQVSTERSLRLAADAACLSTQEDARAEREAAEQAIQRMEAAETNHRQLREETERHIADIQAERDATIERMRIEMQHHVEEVERQAKEAITQAQAAVLTAQEDTRKAETRTHDAETEAHARIGTAEQMTRETRTSMERERAEVDRLRSELTDVHTRAETDRAEARTNLERERAEVDRLRSELTATHQRADRLAALADELRTQLVQAQTSERETPRQ